MTFLEQLQVDQAELIATLRVRYDHSQVFEDTNTSAALIYEIHADLLEEALNMLNAMIDYINVRDRKRVERLRGPD